MLAPLARRAFGLPVQGLRLPRIAHGAHPRAWAWGDRSRDARVAQHLPGPVLLRSGGARQALGLLLILLVRPDRAGETRGLRGRRLEPAPLTRQTGIQPAPGLILACLTLSARGHAGRARVLPDLTPRAGRCGVERERAQGAVQTRCLRCPARQPVELALLARDADRLHHPGLVRPRRAVGAVGASKVGLVRPARRAVGAHRLPCAGCEGPRLTGPAGGALRDRTDGCPGLPRATPRAYHRPCARREGPGSAVLACPDRTGPQSGGKSAWVAGDAGVAGLPCSGQVLACYTVRTRPCHCCP